MSRKVYGQFWKDIGQSDPYFGVLTHPEYRSEQLDEEAKGQFFASGKHHVDRIIKVFSRVFPKRKMEFKNVLDFGCGTGRVSLALADHWEHVVGVDISPGMIKEAEQNRVRLGVKNANFQLIEGNRDFLDQKFDFVHSVMVFQHIHPRDGMEILDYLLEQMSDRGRGYFNLTYYTDISQFGKWKNYLLFSFPRLFKLLRGDRDYAFPMFDYDLSEVHALTHKHRIRRVHTILGATGDHKFVQLFVQKRPLSKD